MHWIIFSVFLCASVVIDSSHSQEPLKLSPSSAQWLDLIGPAGLEAWTVGDPKGQHDWQAIADVKLDPADSKRFAAAPGEGAIWNGAAGKTKDLFSKAKFGDCEAHIEFCIPKESNSGVYFMSHYEIQIFDSHGKEKAEANDCGGIYPRWNAERNRAYEGHAPLANAAKPAGEWQTFDVVFRAPRFNENGKKLANANFERVVHNGVLIHENVEVSGPTRSAAPGPERAQGQLMLQGDHGPVAFRNIRVRALY